MASQAVFSREYFKAWNKTSRVRKVQEAYASITAEAHEEGIDVLQKLRKNGYENYDDFLKECPQFDLFCWPSELAEIGSGFVIYFHFLSFLMIFCLIAGALLLYPFTVYAGQDNLEAWNWDAGGFTSENARNCECIGSNNGYHGPDGQSPTYGTYCGSWDKDYCLTIPETAEWGGTPVGQWCCQKWCYARAGNTRDDGCPTTLDEALPSRSNRQERNLIRSYTACEEIDNTCAATLLQGSDHPGPGIFDYSEPLTRTWFGSATPGHFGPDRANNQSILIVYFVLTAVLCVGFPIVRQYQLRVDSQVDANTTQPNDFALMVEGLPLTATDDSQLMDWFSQNLIAGKSNVEVVKVVIGWNAGEYREKSKRLKQIGEALKGLEPTDDEYKSLQAEQTDIRKALASTADHEAAQLTSSGVVVVIVRKQQDHRDALNQWTSIWARLLNSSPGGLYGFLPGDKLPLYPIGDRPTYKIKLSRAPNPGDINWEDLGVDMTTKVKMFLQTNVAMFFIILVSFWFCYLMVWIQKTQAQSSTDLTVYATQPSAAVLSFLPGLGLMICKVGITLAATTFGAKEFHNTKTQENASQITKMTLAFIVITSFVILYSWAQPKEWYTSPGLVDDILGLMGLLVIRPVFLFMFQISGFPAQSIKSARMKYGVDVGLSTRKQVADLMAGGEAAEAIKKRALCDEKFEKWNHLSESFVAKKGKLEPAERKEFEVAQREIDFWKKMSEQGEMQMMKRYAYAMNLFVCVMVYCPLIPLAPFIGFIGLFLQYWLDKYTLVRIVKRPAIPLSSSQAMASISLLRFVVLVGLPCFTAYVLIPTWEDGKKGKVIQFLIWTLIPCGAVCLLPLSAFRTLLCLRCLLSTKKFEEDEDDPDQDYYKAQHLWPKAMKYHKSHFLYMNLSEAKNPEILTPGEKAVVKLEEVKVGYGSAVKALVGEDGARSSKAGDDAGTRKYGSAAAALEPPAGPPATSYGASTAGAASDDAAPAEPAAEEVAPDAGKAEEEDASEVVVLGTTPAPPAPAKGKGRGKGKGKGKASGKGKAPDSEAARAATWVFETDHGHKPFNDDCQAYIEKQYQKYKAGKGSARADVKTQGMTISMDFEKFTQKAGSKAKIRKIERREAGAE